MEGESYQHTTHNIRFCGNKPTELKIVYLNARSILPKFDELVLMVQARQPDIVSIVESWLDQDVDDSEINISGYQIFRADRSRHGGGVLVYIKSHLTGHAIPEAASPVRLVRLWPDHFSSRPDYNIRAMQSRIIYA